MNTTDRNIINLFKEIVVDDTFDSDYTVEDAAMLIEDAKHRGFDIPDRLTPKMYIQLYNSFKVHRTPEYLMDICKERAEDCLCDINTIEGARQYLKDLKLSGYTVPAMLTPELFLQLYNESEGDE